MNLIATHLAKRFLKRELIAEESLEWCIYGIEKRLSMLDNKILHSHSPAVPPDFFSTDATALKMVAILFDNGLITADIYHQVISRYSS